MQWDSCPVRNSKYERLRYMYGCTMLLCNFTSMLERRNSNSILCACLLIETDSPKSLSPNYLYMSMFIDVPKAQMSSNISSDQNGKRNQKRNDKNFDILNDLL